MSRCKEFKQKQLAGTSAALRPLFVNDLTASLMENLKNNCYANVKI